MAGRETPVLFGEITNAEKAGWQRRALTTLGGVLDSAHRHAKRGGGELPTIKWAVDDGLRVMGTVNGFTQGPEAARADFEAWRGFLGAEMRLDVTHEDGRTVLTAQTSPDGNGVTVMIHADISPAFEE